MEQEKVNRAITRIEQAYQIAQQFGKTLVIAYSGGKDSDVLLDLALKSEVPCEIQHNHTTADAPETVRHIRERFAEVEAHGTITRVNSPEMSMWQLIPKKLMPPTRRVRYCCEYLKERKFEGQQLVTGVRRAESNKRASRGLHETLERQADKRVIYVDENDDARKLTEICHMRNRIVTNPIIDWEDRDVWQYLRENNIKTNPLYNMGLSRVGCVGCPMASKARNLEFRLFPKYRNMYIAAFERMLAERERRGLKTTEMWRDGESVFKWWIEDKTDPNQLTFDYQEKNSNEQI
jgi:phosphoadenosine phosphosulfate reductase